MPRARSIPSSSISSEGNTSLTNIQQPIITKQVGTVKAIRKPIPKEKKKKRKKVAIDPNDEVEVPVVEQITSSKANTTNFTKFNSRSQLFEILKNTEYNFKLVGKIRLNASRVHYIFASDSTILNTEYSKFVYIKLKATDLKDSVGQLYRRQYSAVAPFIQQGFEFLVDKPVADLSKEAIKLQNTGEIVPLPNKKSIIDKLPAALVEKYLMEPVVPNGIKLTEKDILEELLDIWMGEFVRWEKSKKWKGKKIEEKVQDKVFASDGSYENGKGGISWTTKDGTQYKAQAQSPHSSFDCEIQAIYSIVCVTEGNISIITDSEASIKAISSRNKTKNPYLRRIREEKERLNIEFIKAHMDPTKVEQQFREKTIMNNIADKLANEGRISGVRGPPPERKLVGRIVIVIKDKILYDRIDHILYKRLYEPEEESLKRFPLPWRKIKIHPKGEVSRNIINVAIRAKMNSLPTGDKWKKKENCKGCSLKVEDVWHVLHECTCREPTIEDKMYSELEELTKSNQVKKLIKEEILKNQNLISNCYPIMEGYLSKETIRKLEIVGKKKIIQVRSCIIKYTYQTWIRRCNKIHQRE